MARKLLLGALCVLCVTAAFAKEGRIPSFASQLHAYKAKAAGGSKVSVASGGHEHYYEEAPQMCLKESVRDNCNGALPSVPVLPPGSVSPFSFQSQLTCCGEDPTYGYGDKKGLFLKQGGMYSPAVSTCDVVSMLLGAPVPVVPGVTDKVGTAKIICTFFDGAEKCSEELCDGFQFTVEATLYQTLAYSHKAGDAADATIPSDSLCSRAYPVAADGSIPRMGGARQADAKVGIASANSANSANYYESAYMNPYYEDKYYQQTVAMETLYNGTANVFSGLITAVSSPKHHEKFIGGKFEWVADWVAQAATSVTDYRASWINGKGISIELTPEGSY